MKNNNTKVQCKKLFHISRPFGYCFEEVEQTVEKFIAEMQKQKKIILKLKEENVSLKNELQKAQEENRRLQLELSLTTVPNLDDIQEDYIKKKFEDNFLQNKIKKEELKKEPKKIVTAQSVDDTFDLDSFIGAEQNNNTNIQKNSLNSSDDSDDSSDGDFMSKFGF